MIKDLELISQTNYTFRSGFSSDRIGEVIKTVLMETNLPGFFVAGDCAYPPFKQAIISTAAYQYVTQNPLCTK